MSWAYLVVTALSRLVYGRKSVANVNSTRMASVMLAEASALSDPAPLRETFHLRSPDLTPNAARPSCRIAARHPARPQK